MTAPLDLFYIGLTIVAIGGIVGLPAIVIHHFITKNN